jgi:hypothetical protein
MVTLNAADAGDKRLGKIKGNITQVIISEVLFFNGTVLYSKLPINYVLLGRAAYPSSPPKIRNCSVATIYSRKSPKAQNAESFCLPF